MSQTEVQLIKDAVIVNADVSNSAAIDVSKISGAMPLAGGTFTGDILFQSDSGNILFDKSDNALEFSDLSKTISLPAVSPSKVTSPVIVPPAAGNAPDILLTSIAAELLTSALTITASFIS